jgi:hypothetical protein
MKKSILVLLFTVLQLLAFAQTSREINNLFQFSKTWGFLKYHHANVARGNLNWDSVFVTNVQQIRMADKNQFNNILKQILHQAGTHSAEAVKLPDSLFTKNKDDGITWIKQSTLLNPDVKSALINIYNNPYHGKNKYIKKQYHTSDYSGEAAYKDFLLPDVRYRLLILARFWNIINYFAPYKYLIDDDWNNTLRKFIPLFLHADDTTSYYKNLSLLAASINDGHAQVTHNFQSTPVTDRVFGKYTAPFNCQIIGDSVIVRHLLPHQDSDRLNIQVGDKIIKMDDIPVQSLIKKRMPYVSASNVLNKKFMLSWYILNDNKINARIMVEREGKTFPVDIERVDYAETFAKEWRSFVNHSTSDTVCKWMQDVVLLVYTGQIWEGNVGVVKEKIRQSRAVIFDVRNYPNNDAFYAMFDILLPGPTILNYSTVPVHTFPGYFEWVASPKLGDNNPGHYKGQVVILVDERTQSQGEYSSMVLQLIPHAVTFGRQTAGCDGVVTFIPMGGNHHISYSGYGIYYLDKRPTQRVGVDVGIQVPQTTNAIKEGRDEILEKALEYLKH